MTSHKEILRLHSLEIDNTRIASACGCSRTTVINVLQRAKDQGLSWQMAADMSDKELPRRLFPFRERQARVQNVGLRVHPSGDGKKRRHLNSVMA
jgi:hypothetical protein